MSLSILSILLVILLIDRPVSAQSISSLENSFSTSIPPLQNDPASIVQYSTTPEIDSSPIEPTEPSESAHIKNEAVPKIPSPTDSPSVPPALTNIMNGLLPALVPGSAGVGGNPAMQGLFGLLPTISKLSTPLARIIVSNGQPSVEDIDQILKAIPDVAAVLGMMVVNASKSNSANTSATKFSSWTPQQVDDMINGKMPLPPLTSLPPEYVQTVLSGGSLPGTTHEQTQLLKQKYIQALFNGGSASAPLIGNFYANISSATLLTLTKSFQNILAGNMSNFDIQSFVTAIPQLFPNITNTSPPKNNTGEESSNDHRSINANSSISLWKNGRRSSDDPAPYDIDSLDRKTMLNKDQQNGIDWNMVLWICIGLGAFSLVVVILIIVCCCRRYRKAAKLEAARLARARVRTRYWQVTVSPDSIGTGPKPAEQPRPIREVEEGGREIRENEVNEEISRNINGHHRWISDNEPHRHQSALTEV